MTWFDYLIIGVLAISTLIGLWRGFVKEVFSLAGWALAIWVAWNFFRELAPYLADWIDTPSLRLGVAFVALLVVTLMVTGMVTYLLARLVEMSGLTGTDRLVGMVFGAARGVLLIAALVWLAGLTAVPQDPWWQTSVLVPYFEELAMWLRDLLPSDIADRFNYAANGGITDAWWG